MEISPPLVESDDGSLVQADRQSEQHATLTVLRAGWITLAVVLLIVVWMPAPNRWRVATFVPWIVGLAMLMGPSATRAASGWRALFGATEARVSALVLTGLLLVAAWLFSLLACLLLMVWAGATLLFIAVVDRTDSAKAALSNTTFLLVSLAAVGFTLEGVFRRPAIAGTFGLPSEQRRVYASYDHLEQRNLLGIRSAYERIAKPAGVRRVVAIGDSFTWGDHILQTDSTWPAQLERALVEAAGGARLDVINIAQRGYTTVNEVEATNRIGWQFDPDLVVVQWLVNDVYPSGTGFQAERIWPPVPHLLPEAFRAGAIRDSDLYGFLQQRYTSFKLGTRYTAYAALYNDTNPDWIANQRAFRELGDSARARGVPVVLMIWPTIGTEVWTSETHPQRDIHALVAKVATEAGLHVFDLTSAFGVAGGDPKRWWARPYDRHPSPQADSLAVHELLGFLAGHRLDPRSVAQGIR